MVSDSGKDIQADTPWSALCCELTLLTFSVVAPIVSLLVDLKVDHPEWFQRSGALMVLFSGLLAYMSVTKHYQKFYNNMRRGYPLKTSRNQTIVDLLTLFVSILGTVIWGYGDKLI